MKRIALLAGLALALCALAGSSAQAAPVTIGQLFAPTQNCSGDYTDLQTAVASGTSYTAPVAGVITSWSFEGGATAVTNLKLKVARPAGPGSFTIIGEAAAGSQVANMVNTYQTQIPVAAGDLIGIHEGPGGDCEAAGTSADKDAFAAGDVSPGTTSTFGADSGARFPVSARIEPMPSHTAIIRAQINRKRRKATFGFTGSDATSFQCELIKPKRKHRKKPKAIFLPCSSPTTYKHLRPGRYTFEVRGVNVGGVDPMPAIKKFKI